MNREKDGQGKEYFSNRQILFEGEYKNGMKWTGKGYDKNGKVLYELKNGNGPVKELFEKGELIFEGEYLTGKRNGKGKQYYFGNRSIFEGE